MSQMDIYFTLCCSSSSSYYSNLSLVLVGMLTLRETYLVFFIYGLYDDWLGWTRDKMLA